MSEYVPTTDEVRLRFAYEERPAGGTSPYLMEAFDRWLEGERAAARREGQAEAWKEGWAARASRPHLGMYECIPAPDHINPYRNREDRHVDQ